MEKKVELKFCYAVFSPLGGRLSIDDTTMVFNGKTIDLKKEKIIENQNFKKVV